MSAMAEHLSGQCRWNFGTPIIVWFDIGFRDVPAYQKSLITDLQQAGNTVKTFDNPDELVDFITDIEDEKIIVIVSNDFCQTILQYIHDFQQIVSIYTSFRDHPIGNNEWKTDLNKLHDVFTDTTAIVDSVKQETRIIEYNLESIFILDCSAEFSSELDLNNLNPDFMYLQILKELILEADYDAQAKDEFVEYCCHYCTDNEASLRIVEEMRQDYDKHSPIWWYTRETFLFRLLNKSLRDLNGAAIWKLRPFIKDIHRALEQLQFSYPMSTTKLFRGQSMAKANFERLKRNIGGLLSFNSFVSTSAEENVANSFILGIGESHPALVAVIFEIDVDSSMKTSSPFASVADLSHMREAEILFSIHTVFRIGDMKQFEDGIWHVQLKMTLDEDKQLRELTEYTRRQCLADPLDYSELELTAEEQTQIRQRLAGGINMVKFCYVLSCMGQRDKCVEILLARYRDHFGTNPDDFIYKLSSFSMITDVADFATQGADIERHVQEFENILVQSPPSDKKQLATLYTLLARYSKQRDRALYYQLRAFELFQELNCTTQEDLIYHYNEVGDIHYKERRFHDALTNYERACQLSVELQLPTHPLLSKCYFNIGQVHYQLGNYERAWEYQKQSLDISYKSLPATHPEILNVHNACAATLMALARYPEAIQHLEKAMEIVQSRTGHESVIDMYNEILDNLRS